ncbi:FxSxx-COOH system tetratricopeptide repeat protein [Streptomyces sp. NPDC049879]|uniref:FxSxx-COOH system tetratricopeptide repeat protein n=1 Tax=Streptomyces sp. NPDC049879 TaxID=3365598 RepID=UPI0037A6D4CE
MNDGPAAGASGERSVAVGTNHGVVSTGDGATIDARVFRLPDRAVRTPDEVAAAPGLHNLPAPRSQVFVDRQDSMALLVESVGGGGGTETVPTVVHGLGGTGKSALALQFAHEHRDRWNPVWWLAADTPAGVTEGLAALAARLDPHAGLTGRTDAENAAWAIDWLRAHTGWLLVLDNADSPRGLAPVLGALASGRHLITSRRATGWHHLARALPLGTLPQDAALDLLARIAGPDEAERAVLDRLATELGCLPLALEQAAAYIRHTAITPAAYLDRLRRHPARMFAAAGGAGEADNERTIARIWRLSLQAMDGEEPLAGEILRTFAWYAPEPVPRDLAYGLHDDPLAVDDALALLHSYSMAALTPRTVAVHRLVQAVARTQDPADPHRTAEAVGRARESAARLLASALPGDPLFDHEGWPRWRELLPHVLAFTGLLGADEETPVTASLHLAASGFLLGNGHFDQAVTSGRRAVAAYGATHGPDAPMTLTARSFLASALRSAGDPEATALHEANAADCARVLGPEHTDTLAARANLAYLYALSGRTADALALHERNLADHERLLGPDHPHTLNARANVASSYRDLGDLARAVELHERSAADYARVFGEEHPEALTALANLAYACRLAGGTARAVRLYRQVLAGRERLFGEDHLWTEQARQLLSEASREPGDG